MASDASSSAVAPSEALFPMRRRSSRMRPLVRFARTQPLATFGLAALVVGVIIALVGPSLVPKDPYATSIITGLEAPSGEHWFGTDNLGRDVFSRVIVATRFSLLLGLAATAVTLLIGVVIGLISGYLGGFVDVVIQRLVEAAMGIPFILFLLMVVTLVGASFTSIAIIIGGYGGITNSRVIRSAVLSVKEEMYMEAARSIGVPAWRILLMHVLPNIMATVIIVASLGLGAAILAESSLSFLGYGVPPPDPTWGQMMGIEARPYIIRGPWMAIFPGLVLTIVVFSINVLGDGLRDALDPRLRSR